MAMHVFKNEGTHFFLHSSLHMWTACKGKRCEYNEKKKNQKQQSEKYKGPTDRDVLYILEDLKHWIKLCSMK